MLLKPPTSDQLRATFDAVLAGIRRGRLAGCPSDTGLDDQTVTALDGVAQHTTTAEQARAELEKMLDGTHARQTRQRIEQP
jgi:hypothetical protein